MFDAKSLLESLVTGGAKQSAQPAAGGNLGDLLGQILGANPSQATSSQNTAQSNGGGGLGDLLGQLQSAGKQGAGGIPDILGQVLGQATQGVKEGAGKINEATGAGDALGDAARQLSQQMAGKSPEQVMDALKDLIANNKLGAGAALGGLGALILGTSTGRSIAIGATKLGALALISGLAYKAYQNYADGKPLITGANGETAVPPSGSGFEPDAIDNDQAALYIRTMIAAAAADGRIDSAEHDQILGGLKQAGIDAEAEQFLANELNNPASIEDLALAVANNRQAVQVYTAARIAIDPDTSGEAAFLSQLATSLGIDRDLASHIDAAARNA